MLLYSATGARWANPVRITYSIVPDGTTIGGTPSNLGATLADQPGWQQRIQTAAAVWEAVAGINLVQVGDNGAPIGSSGNQQGDPGFGDIRIGGMPQSDGQLAFAFTPPTFNGGPNAGDIFFNTAQPWQVDGNTFDLQTVALHEFGHALGMGHSQIAAADMYSGYIGANQALTSDDIQGIQSIYGPRQNDTFDGASGNNHQNYATDISPYLGGDGQVALASLDVTSRNDADWYRVTVPQANAGAMTIRTQSSALSSLSPQVEVYTESLAFLGRVSAPNSFGWTVGGTVDGVGAGQSFYIKVLPANTGPSGTGNYGLMVNFGSNPQAAIAPPQTAVAAQPDRNPGITHMGSGWMLGGNLTLFLGNLDARLGLVDLGFGPLPLTGLTGPLQTLLSSVNGLLQITYGTLSGFGQAEMVADHLAGHDHHHVGGGDGDGADHDGQDPSYADEVGRPSGTSDATAIAPAGGIGVDLGRWSLEPSPRLKAGGLAKAELVGLDAVDAALLSWRPEGSTGADLPSDGEPFSSILRDGTNPRGRRKLPHALTLDLRRGLP